MFTEFVKLMEESFDDSKDGYCRITQMAKVKGSWDVELTIQISSDPEIASQAWNITCQSALRYYISKNRSQKFTYTQNHPLLWPLTEEEWSLWFNGRSSEYNAIIGELWQTQHKLTDNWFSFSEFLNQSDSLQELLTGGHGLIARGPKSMISAFKVIMQKYGINTSTTTRLPHYQENDLSVLIIGDSYFTARNFEAQRIS